MTPADAARVLAKCAAFDSRTIGATDAAAWSEALDGIDLTDALRAVTRHYRDSERRIMPANVRSHVGEIVRERVGAAIATARELPPCPHGDNGGTFPHPVTGLSLCPLCRHAALTAGAS